MRSRNARLALTLLAIAAGLGGGSRVQTGIDQQLAAIHQERDDLLVRSGPLLKTLSLDHAAFLADVYWTRVVQYYGGKHVRHDQNLELLWPLLDLTTTLDPHLLVAYRFGGAFLAEARPGGAGQPDLGVELLQRGIRSNPEYWRFYQDLGMIYYWDLHDYKKAAEAFLEGSRIPGAMEWMKVMAAKLAEEGESGGTSLFLWRQIYDSTRDPDIRQNAANHVKLLAADEDRSQLDALIAEFTRRNNRLPQTIGELARAGMLRGVPVDAEGFPYVIGPAGTAELHLRSPLRALQSQMNLPAPPH